MPMRRVSQPDPRLLVENMRDDLAETLRGYDRSPEAKPSPHLWRAALPTYLAAGEHRVEVRAFDAWQGDQPAGTPYRLQPLPEPPFGHLTARRTSGSAISHPCGAYNVAFRVSRRTRNPIADSEDGVRTPTR